jgi:hypothetical protein
MMRILLPSISNYCMQRNGATRYFNAYFALPSADADDVVRTGLTRDGCDRMRYHPGSRRLAAPSHPEQNTLKHNTHNISVQWFKRLSKHPILY